MKEPRIIAPEGNSSVRRPAAAPATRSAAPAAGFSVERLRSGWRLLADCPLGPIRIHVVLIRPGGGVALLEVEPTWHPGALAAFQAILDQDGFAARFPGRLPVIHRRLRPVDLPAIEEILQEAFAWQDPISIEGAWEDDVERILTPAPVPAGRAPASPLPGTPRRRRLGLAAGLAVAGVAAGLGAIAVVAGRVPRGDPSAAPQVAILAPEDGSATGGSAAIGPAAAGGPPPAWVDGPVSPPPLPAAVIAPQRLAWLPPPGAAMGAPPGPVASAVFWAGPVPRALPLPAAAAGLPAAPAQVAPPPGPQGPPAPAALGQAPPRAAESRHAALPAPASVPPPPAARDQPGAAAPQAGTQPAIQPAMEPAMQAVMLRRGQALLAIGDISGARLFLERAASRDSAAAAMALAETYDPGRLAGLGVIGLPADPAAALSWYRRALGLGAPEAADRIATLEGSR
jgi:hypothetical protein